MSPRVPALKVSINLVYRNLVKTLCRAYKTLLNTSEVAKAPLESDEWLCALRGPDRFWLASERQEPK